MENENNLEVDGSVEVLSPEPEMVEKTVEDPVVELHDAREHISENQALAEIQNILNHPGLRDPSRLRRRLWLYLHTIMGAQF